MLVNCSINMLAIEIKLSSSSLSSVDKLVGDKEKRRGSDQSKRTNT